MWRLRAIANKPYLKDAFVLSLVKHYAFVLEQKGPAHYKDMQECRELLRDDYWKNRDLERPILSDDVLFMHYTFSVIGLGLCFSGLFGLVDCCLEVCDPFLLKKCLFQLYFGYRLESANEQVYKESMQKDQQRERILVLLEEAIESKAGQICEQEYTQNREGYDDTRVRQEILDDLDRERAKLMTSRILTE